MEQILEFILEYGLPVFIIACCIIAVIGILKLCKIFSKINNKNIKKGIYYFIDIILSFSFVAIYLAIFKHDFSSYLLTSCTQVSATTTLYAIYENFGVRGLWQICLTGITNWFHKNPEHKFVKAAKALGIDDEKINTLLAENKPADTEENNK